ncbi:hypothetical protein KOAAANKH_01675 [Brevundimonas sp. NIBR10]|nr:hypothetical protein [Brevundimonas sp. NIBR10]WGM46802.1 hypothetical protein KOAAANKH_01675 [Brevundimonas sp. NIBR10]
MADPSDPDDRDPRETDLQRRSAGPAISPWLVIGLIAMLGVGVYAVMAMM